MGVLFVQAAIDRVQEERTRTAEMKTQWVMTARKRALRELVEVRDKTGQAVIADELAVAAETSSSEVEEDVVDDALGPVDAASHPTGSNLTAFVPPFLPPGLGAGASSSKPRQPRKNLNPPPPSLDVDSAFFFYQAASGQHVRNSFLVLS